jgi:hypothetical protein
VRYLLDLLRTLFAIKSLQAEGGRKERQEKELPSQRDKSFELHMEGEESDKEVLFQSEKEEEEEILSLKLISKLEKLEEENDFLRSSFIDEERRNQLLSSSLTSRCAALDSQLEATQMELEQERKERAIEESATAHNNSFSASCSSSATHTPRLLTQHQHQPQHQEKRQDSNESFSTSSTSSESLKSSLSPTNSLSTLHQQSSYDDADDDDQKHQQQQQQRPIISPTSTLYDISSSRPIMSKEILTDYNSAAKNKDASPNSNAEGGGATSQDSSVNTDMVAIIHKTLLLLEAFEAKDKEVNLLRAELTSTKEDLQNEKASSFQKLKEFESRLVIQYESSAAIKKANADKNVHVQNANSRVESVQRDMIRKQEEIATLLSSNSQLLENKNEIIIVKDKEIERLRIKIAENVDQSKMYMTLQNKAHELLDIIEKQTFTIVKLKASNAELERRALLSTSLTTKSESCDNIGNY